MTSVQYVVYEDVQEINQQIIAVQVFFAYIIFAYKYKFILIF